MSISISGRQIASRLLAAVIGMCADANPLADMNTAPYINSDPCAVQTYTVVVTGATNNKEYIYTVDGVEVSYTSDGSASVAEIANGLAAAHQANGAARGLFSAVSDGVDTVTLTAVNQSIDVVVTDSDAQITTTETQAPALANAVGFGLGIVALGADNGNGTETGTSVYAAKLTAQVDTLTVVYASGELYLVTIEVPGQAPKTVNVAANTDTATTTTDIVTAINNIMPANTVLAASSVAGTITLTAEIPGQAFVTGIGTKTGTASRLSVANTVATALTNALSWFAGVSRATLDAEVTEIDGDSASYAPASGISVLRKGRIYVQSDESPTPSDKVYVETLAGSTQGRFYATGSATRVYLPQCRWATIPSRTSAEGLALLAIN